MNLFLVLVITNKNFLQNRTAASLSVALGIEWNYAKRIELLRINASISRQAFIAAVFSVLHMVLLSHGHFISSNLFGRYN